ncbi:MAG: hypothetical protein AAF561_03250 [Planctomycetota bacterium]
MIGALVVAAYRITSVENQSPLWVGLALGLAIASLFLPLPLVRVLIAGVVWFIVYMFGKQDNP